MLGGNGWYALTRARRGQDEAGGLRTSAAPETLVAGGAFFYWLPPHGPGRQGGDAPKMVLQVSYLQAR